MKQESGTKEIKKSRQSSENGAGKKDSESRGMNVDFIKNFHKDKKEIHSKASLHQS